MNDRDLPEGVINADPPGAWESGASADAETAEQNRQAQGSSELTDSGFPSTAAEGNGAPVAPSDPPDSADATQGADPDLTTDPDLGTDEED